MLNSTVNRVITSDCDRRGFLMPDDTNASYCFAFGVLAVWKVSEVTQLRTPSNCFESHCED